MRMWLLFMMAVSAFIAGAAEAADSIRVRGWSHDDYGRIVFDWPSSVEYSVSRSGRNLSVRFNKPFDADFAGAIENMPQYLRGAEVSRNGRTAVLRMAKSFDFKDFRNKNAIVIDLRQPSVPELPVRVGAHPNYNRLVFDWVRDVEYTAKKTGDIVEVRFSEAAQINSSDVASTLPAGFSIKSAGTQQGRTTFALQVPEGARIRHFRAGARVVLDVLDPVKQETENETVAAQKEKAPPSKQEAKAEADEVRPPTPPAAAVPQAPVENNEPARAPQNRAAAGQSSVAAVNPENQPGIEPANAAAEQNTEPDDSRPRRLLPATGEAPQGESAAAAAVAGTGEEGTPPPAQQPEQASSPGENQTAVNAAQPTAAQESNVAAASESQPAADAAPSIVFREDTTRRRTLGGRDVSLVFEWPEPVAAAVFQRAGYNWIIFEQRTSLNLAPLRAAGEGVITRIEQLPVSSATVVRIVAAPEMRPVARRDGPNWVVDFAPGAIQPEIEIPIEPNPEADGGPQLFFPAIEVGKVLTIPDPEVGDAIQVATVQAAGHGIRGNRAYPEFQLIGTAQGIVMNPISDDVELRKTNEGLIIVTPGGLHISGVSPDIVQGIAANGKVRRLFDLRKWSRQGGSEYYAARQKLMDAIASQPQKGRNKARMDLARFYFARGFAPEALGVLRTIQLTDPRLAESIEFKALNGAVSAMLGRGADAANDLRDTRLDKYDEVQIWRGVAAAAMNNPQLAQQYFNRGDVVLRQYLEPLRTKIGIIRAETALEARDADGAGRWLRTLDKNTDAMSRSEVATLRYLQGRAAFVRRNLDRATTLWSQLKDGDDRLNSVRSDLSLVNLGLLQETMPVEEAINRLENLRYRWRGDEFELQVLRRLGDLYLDQPDYRNGLKILRSVVTHFPNHPSIPGVAEKMSSVFRDLYLGGIAETLSPLTALALYDEFRELTPAGEEGNIMIQKLAERLVDVDLLNRSADLLLHQVKFRLKGVERAKVGAKLAVIRLLDRDPKGAIEALRISDFPRLDEELEDDRRRILARARFETGEAREAIELLAGDVSRNADLLRADIYWRTENWSQAANVLQRLAGEPLPAGQAFPLEQAKIVLNWAVALQLDKDEVGLKLLRDVYGPAMAAGPLSNAFEFIARAARSGEPLDIQTITERIAANDVFEAFMTDYRERLLKSPVKKEEPKKPSPPPAAANDPVQAAANNPA